MIEGLGQIGELDTVGIIGAQVLIFRMDGVVEDSEILIHFGILILPGETLGIRGGILGVTLGMHGAEDLRTEDFMIHFGAHHFTETPSMETHGQEGIAMASIVVITEM